ncbi:peptide chain release factor 2 [Lachnoanaerobaculum orale]|uniref:Peptide chain release factor 2 n=1 Tax=Lachnoanaerobaculum orale TaxID=979627 RepID=A0A3P3Q3K2_9FIRM|nr:peptide chain release factor 2 [Lachnoanaerobaculum orale]MBS6728348.1 peptide chain release factor 2 [Lachnospiraceae bacterium oral taxon 082]RRJ15807.1 peptide chain release factor 2 [Lachnoanaerobaculum orale]
MVELDGFKTTLQSYEKILLEVRDSLDLDSKEKKIIELDRAMEEPTFWDDPKESTKIVREAKQLKDTVEKYNKLKSEYEDIGVLIEMGYEENDESLIPEIEGMLEAFTREIDDLKIATLLTGEYDSSNAIMKLNAGAGGTESCDWCSMLYRMYTRWAAKEGYTVEVLDMLEGDEAGIKSVTLQINGINAYGYLRSEHGVHRLVRISPFNAAGKRQTSFVSCDIMPDIEEDLDVDINPDDLRIDTYRSSGAGGQHINKTSSAIRITHIPTGVVVQCQNERSQFQNKDKAMQMLKAKLFLLKQQANVEKLSDIRGDVKDIGWGNQIRSYVMQPYTMVKDHRTGAESGNVSAVLDGDIDKFIIAYLTWQSLGCPARNAGDE